MNFLLPTLHLKSMGCTTKLDSLHRLHLYLSTFSCDFTLRTKLFKCQFNKRQVISKLAIRKRCLHFNLKDEGRYHTKDI